MQYVFEKRKQGKITFSGDHVKDHDSALVISNHRSWSDFYMIHSVALRRNMLDNCKYFVKDSIKWLPFFGWGMWLAGFVFVKRNWLQDQNKINKTFASIKKLNTPAWIINYVEGSRFTPQKSALCQSFAREHGYTVTENVLLPRTKGFLTCVQQFRHSHIKYIYGSFFFLDIHTYIYIYKCNNHAKSESFFFLSLIYIYIIIIITV
ncbi:unnamed protein product [Cunninghamella blakesleeana]